MRPALTTPVSAEAEVRCVELTRVTRYQKLQKRITLSAAGSLINQLRKVAIMVDDVPVPDIFPDSDDNWLLGLARKGCADLCSYRQ